MTALAFPFAAASIICSACFQSLGYNRFSLAVSVLRYGLLPLPAAMVLVRVVPQGSFLCFLVGEAATMLVAIAMFRRVRREKINSIGAT